MLVRPDQRTSIHRERIVKQRLYLIAAVVVLSTACNHWPFEADLWTDGNWLSEQRVSAPSSEITVMTQNHYLGALQRTDTTGSLP